MDVLEALRQLDPGNDDHWNASNQPNVTRLKSLTMNPHLTRKEVTAVAPGFNRDNPVLPGGEPDAVDEPDAPQAAAETPKLPDAIDLFEQAVKAAGQDRFKRNSALQVLVRHWQVDQAAVREIQKRLDQRASDKIAASLV